MIYEMRTYTLRPRSLPEVLKRYEAAYEHRRKYSPLAAFWVPEIGELNQIIHVWPYKDMAERDRIRAESTKDPNWPPKIQEFIVKQKSEIMVPAPFSPEIQPGRMGPLFEIRTYTVLPGQMPKVMKIWEAALPHRLAVGPVVAVWVQEHGDVSRFVHIWGYESFAHRDETRKKAQATGNWPPSAHDKKQGGTGYELARQENRFVVPSAFSPLQ